MKTIIITGGSSGIGFHLAADLLKRGDNVGIISNDQAKLTNAANSLGKINSNVASYCCDVRDMEGLGKAIAAFHSQFGKIDVLVNNAGFARYLTFEQTTIDELIAVNEVNFMGAVKATKAVLPLMVEQGFGHIVNIASLAGKFPIAPNAIYCGAKHGIVGFSNALRYEVKRYNVKISVICPGRVKTSFCDDETFKNRSPRPETRLNSPIERVVNKMIKIIDSPKAESFLPSYWSIVSWFKNSCPIFIDPLFDKIHHDRIEEIYAKKQ